MTRTVSAIAIVLAALALAPASAESAELTGCLSPRGTLTKVAPGVRPAAPCGQRAARLERDQRLRRFVHQRLLEAWTPEPIAGWLERGEERNLPPLCAETIYAFIHRPAQKAERLWRLLPRSRARRGHRRAPAPQPDRRSRLDPRAPACGRWPPRSRPLGG